MSLAWRPTSHPDCVSSLLLSYLVLSCPAPPFGWRAHTFRVMAQRVESVSNTWKQTSGGDHNCTLKQNFKSSRTLPVAVLSVPSPAVSVRPAHLRTLLANLVPPFLCRRRHRRLPRLKINDSSGAVNVTEIPRDDHGHYTRDMLESGDAYILDAGSQIFVWIGKGASPQERKESMQIAMNFIRSEGRPEYTPIERVVRALDDSLLGAMPSSPSRLPNAAKALMSFCASFSSSTASLLAVAVRILVPQPYRHWTVGRCTLCFALLPRAS